MDGIHHGGGCGDRAASPHPFHRQRIVGTAGRDLVPSLNDGTSLARGMV